MTKLKKPDAVDRLDPSQWDLEELMERLDGDGEFLRELLVIFQQEAPANLVKSRDALAAVDFPGLTHAAHTLKGMLKNLAMGAAAETAAALETTARKELMEESKQRLEQLAGELESLFPEIEARLGRGEVMRVLIAEDDTLSRTLLERTLQRAGYDVVAVPDGAEALVELAKQDAPRLALLDWVMPQKDGLAVCREVRQRKDQAYTYLILLSSRETKQDIVFGLESGADDYLTKPFDVDELKARLRTGERILELEDRLVEARESMRFQATHDLLTSLWNRGVIMELATREIFRTRREGSCTAVMMCDIDHFKKVNDQYGHAVGDEVLREVARRLQLSVRSYDMVGRYGGEEFLVALNRCDAGSAVSRAENLRAVIGGRPIQAGSQKLTVTISIGLALSTEFGDCSVDEIMHEADMALYAAKAGGRNCVRVAAPGSSKKAGEAKFKEPPVLTQ